MARVLLVGKGEPERGGIPVFIDMLRRSALSDHHTIGFLNLSHGGVPEGGRVTLGNVRRTVADVVRVLRAARGADIVHIHSALAPIVTLVRASLLALAGRVGGSRVVLHVHGGRFQETPGSPLLDRALRVLLRPVDRAIAVSAEGGARLSDILGPGRATVIVNGVDTHAFGPPQPVEGDPVVLHVGLLTPRKGVIDLMAASDVLVARGVQHELRLVGGTPDEGPEAERQVREAAGVAARFVGVVDHDQLPEVYAQATVFCLASWWEATPLTILEAMATGLPVVGTDVGGIPHLVDHGRTGLVVPVRDPERLADAIEALLLDEDVRQRMGAEARRRVRERHDLSRVVTAVHVVYGDVLTAAGASPPPQVAGADG